eukprot:503718-Alexandrium_andersonii.AAC.1
MARPVDRLALASRGMGGARSRALSCNNAAHCCEVSGGGAQGGRPWQVGGVVGGVPLVTWVVVELEVARLPCSGAFGRARAHRRRASAVCSTLGGLP